MSDTPAEGTTPQPQTPAQEGHFLNAGPVLSHEEQLPEFPPLNPLPTTIKTRVPRLPRFHNATPLGTRVVTLPDGRVMSAEEFAYRWDLLRAPFPDEWLQHKPVDMDRGQGRRPKCEPRPNGRWGEASKDGLHCGNYHYPAKHITYVGHARINLRLLDVDPYFDLQLDTDELGRPIIQPGTNWVWGTLVVLGKVQRCVGDAGGKNLADGNAIKELYGDAMRNGAMRLGCGLGLWAGELDVLYAQEFAETNTYEEAQDRHAEFRGTRQNLHEDQNVETAAFHAARQDAQAEHNQAVPHPNSRQPQTAPPGDRTRLSPDLAAQPQILPEGDGEPWSAEGEVTDGGWKRIIPGAQPKSDGQWITAWMYYASFGAGGFEYFKNLAMSLFRKHQFPNRFVPLLQPALDQLVAAEA